MWRLPFVVALALVVPAPLAVSARTLHVPAEYGSLRQAVHLAAEGDSVLVAPGTYRERFTVRNKNIVVRGEMGAGATTIDGSVAKGNVVTLTGVERSMILEDFTITGGTFNEVARESLGAGIYVNQGRPTIQRCILTGNDASTGGGVVAYFFAGPLIQDCWIAYNEGGGIFVEVNDGLATPTNRAEIRNCFIVCNRGFGVSVIKGAKALLENCTIAANTGDGLRSELTPGGGIGKCYVGIRRCIITDNGGAGIVRRDFGVCFELLCNDVWRNGPNGNDNWVGTLDGDPCFQGRDGSDLSFDPEYDNPSCIPNCPFAKACSADDFVLATDSALRMFRCGTACGIPGAGNICTDAIQSTSWGALKSLYR